MTPLYLANTLSDLLVHSHPRAPPFTMLTSQEVDTVAQKLKDHFAFFENCDSGHGDREQLLGSLMEVAMKCVADPTCLAFNTAGWVKDSLRAVHKWDRERGQALLIAYQTRHPRAAKSSMLNTLHCLRSLACRKTYYYMRPNVRLCEVNDRRRRTASRSFCAHAISRLCLLEKQRQL